jgi:hypothetical protein
MQPREFYNRIAEHPHLTWLGCKEGATPAEDQVLIGFDGHGSWQPSKFAVTIAALNDHSWSELEAVLTSQRSPRIMTHITRIVGYYSQLQNWNASKLAELRDRQNGNYGVPEAQVEGDGNVEVACEEQTSHASAGEPAGV